MRCIQSTDGALGVMAMANQIAEELQTGKVLWLVCGGSSIALAVQAMRRIRAVASQTDLQNLTIGLTDERYGEVGHKDSNWQQLINAEFDLSGVHTLPILRGSSLEETVAAYAQELETAFRDTNTVVAQFGIGADDHVAGILPHTPVVRASELVASYDAPPYVRITITPPAFTYLHTAYTFVFGESKRAAVLKLRDQSLPIADMPSQLLKQIPESYVYSDQL